jgi:hypothetical protein
MAVAWQESVPVVTVRAGVGGGDPQVFTGYGASVEDCGAVVIFEVEPDGFDKSKTKRKPKGRVLVLANGMWETVESEWQPVGEGGLVIL